MARGARSSSLEHAAGATDIDSASAEEASAPAIAGKSTQRQSGRSRSMKTIR